MHRIPLLVIIIMMTIVHAILFELDERNFSKKLSRFVRNFRLFVHKLKRAIVGLLFAVALSRLEQQQQQQ